MTSAPSLCWQRFPHRARRSALQPTGIRLATIRRIGGGVRLLPAMASSVPVMDAAERH